MKYGTAIAVIRLHSLLFTRSIESCFVMAGLLAYTLLLVFPSFNRTVTTEIIE